MNKVMKAIEEFHAVFDEAAPSTPTLPELRERKLRRKLLKEEFLEYKQAENTNDIVEIADALADMVYIIAGTAHKYGINLEAVFDEVHASNMKKFPNGKVLRRPDGKITKPEGWQPPNIREAMNK